MDILYELHRLKEEKLKNLDDLKKIRFSNLDEKMVFVSGCFDLLHAEHISFLAWARELGDYLVVAINSDESIKKLKGKDRPFRTLKKRITMLIPNVYVNYIIPFEEKDVTKILRLLKPQIFAKGRNYVSNPSRTTTKKVAINQYERNIVKSYGGKIYFLDKKPKVSSSNLIEKIRGHLSR